MFDFPISPIPSYITALVPARQWQAAKQRPTQFGDNKNRPSKYIPSKPAKKKRKT